MAMHETDSIRLISVNVGEERSIVRGKPSGKTGIFKLPQQQPVMVNRLGLEGDLIVDTQNHGGPDQAVYIYTRPDYEWWSAQLGRSLEPGTFGENLTLSALESALLHVGDRFRAGAVLLEVTAPRLPCVTIAARMEDPQFVRKFREAERPGVYCRVVEEGTVQVNQAVQWIAYEGEHVTMREFFRAYLNRDGVSADDVRRLLSTPVSLKVRAYYAKHSGSGHA
jgi:MOSC domain-containing protein YiiM